MTRKKKIRGLTLVEVVFVVGFFVLLTLMLLSMFFATNGYWAGGNQEASSSDDARQVYTMIFNEMKQAIPDPDPGKTGYLQISPPVAPTGILTPNANSASSTTVIFDEPNPANFLPFSPDWNPDSPANYQQIQYAISGTALLRYLTTYNAGGAPTTQSESVLTLNTEPDKGTVSLQFNCVVNTINNSCTSYDIQVITKEGVRSDTISSEIYPEGQGQ